MFDDLRPNNFNSTGNSTLVLKEHVIFGSLQPLPSSSKQTITFLVDISKLEEKSCFVALRAIDRAGHYGEVSNIVSAPFPLEEALPNNTGLSTKAIVAIVIGSLLGVLLIAALSYLIVKKKYLTYSRTETQPKPTP